MIARRLRIVAWRIQPLCFVDDGENLRPLVVQAIDIAPENWDDFVVSGKAAAEADLQAQIDGATASDQTQPDQTS